MPRSVHRRFLVFWAPPKKLPFWQGRLYPFELNSSLLLTTLLLLTLKLFLRNNEKKCSKGLKKAIKRRHIFWVTFNPFKFNAL